MTWLVLVLISKNGISTDDQYELPSKITCTDDIISTTEFMIN